jgi:hypothetical protein
MTEMFSRITGDRVQILQQLMGELKKIAADRPKPARRALTALP